MKFLFYTSIFISNIRCCTKFNTPIIFFFISGPLALIYFLSKYHRLNLESSDIVQQKIPSVSFIVQRLFLINEFYFNK